MTEIHIKKTNTFEQIRITDKPVITVKPDNSVQVIFGEPLDDDRIEIRFDANTFKEIAKQHRIYCD